MAAQEKMMSDEEVESRFHYHAPSGDGVKRHALLSQSYVNLAHLINTVLPNGREKSLAMTELETSKFWASAAVARNPDTR